MGKQELAELREVFDRVAPTGEAQAAPGGLVNRLAFDVTLARGLNYYTGAIWEVAVDTSAPGQENIRMGSIAAGGRYADLTAIFGLKDTPGVGISFGAERIYDVLEELDAFPPATAHDLDYLIVCLDDQTLPHGFALAGRLRARGLATDLYPKAAKLQKMLKYADQRGVARVIIIGSEEVKTGRYAVKDMGTGEQVALGEEEL